MSSTPVVVPMEEYTWIVVLGLITSFIAAFGIGANDVANAFATSVGSKALTVKQACALAVVFEFAGAVALGSNVVETIRKDIADPSYFVDNPPLLVWGSFCVLLAVSIWLLLATKLEMPVSTTHSCVGGLVGMAMAAYGSDAVIWYKNPNPAKSKFLPGGFLGVVLSWFFSPILSGIFAMVFFAVIRTFVLRSKRAFERAVLVYPILVFLCVWIVSLFMLIKGIKSSADIKSMSIGTKIGISAGIGAGVSILSIPLYFTCKKRILTGKFVPPPLAIEVAEQTKATAVESGTKDAAPETEAGPTTAYGKFMKAVSTSLNTDPHASVGVDARTTEVHKNAEKFDKNAEAFFTYLQIFSAIFDAFAHGANDVANAVGPFATIWLVYNSGTVSTKDTKLDDTTRILILGLGGIGIGVGLLLYGYQILRAIGVKLAVITPSRGFCIEMGSSIVVIIGSQMGIPLSTTHCQVGATAGVALLEGVGGCNKWVLFKTAFGWIITCVVVGLFAGIFFSIGAYSPMVHQQINPKMVTSAACAVFNNQTVLG